MGIVGRAVSAAARRRRRW